MVLPSSPAETGEQWSVHSSAGRAANIYQQKSRTGAFSCFTIEWLWETTETLKPPIWSLRNENSSSQYLSCFLLPQGEFRVKVNDNKYETEHWQKISFSWKTIIWICTGNNYWQWTGSSRCDKNAVIWEFLRDSSTDAVHLLHPLEDWSFKDQKFSNGEENSA